MVCQGRAGVPRHPSLVATAIVVSLQTQNTRHQGTNSVSQRDSKWSDSSGQGGWGDHTVVTTAAAATSQGATTAGWRRVAAQSAGP